jgi:hypothetical protein
MTKYALLVVPATLTPKVIQVLSILAQLVCVSAHLQNFVKVGVDINGSKTLQDNNEIKFNLQSYFLRQSVGF